MNIAKTTNTIGKGLILLSLLLWATCARAQTPTFRTDPAATAIHGVAFTESELAALRAIDPVMQFMDRVGKRALAKDYWHSDFRRAEYDALYEEYGKYVVATYPNAGKKFAHAQQPKPGAQEQTKPDPKPITLSVEASQRYIDLENRKAELRKQYGEVLNQQDSLLVGAQMAPEQRKAVEAWQPPAEPPWKATDGMITFLPPKVAEVKKP